MPLGVANMNDDITILNVTSRLMADFRVIAENKPELARQLVLLFQEAIDAEPSDMTAVSEDRAMPLWGDTHFEAIANLLKSTGSRFLSVPDICSRTGIGRGAVAQVLYSSHAEYFDRMPHPHHSKMKVWRLRDRCRLEDKPAAQVEESRQAITVDAEL